MCGALGLVQLVHCLLGALAARKHPHVQALPSKSHKWREPVIAWARADYCLAQVWMGEIKGPEYYRQLYSVDAVHYADEILPVLEGLKAPALHVLHGNNTDRCPP